MLAVMKRSSSSVSGGDFGMAMQPGISSLLPHGNTEVMRAFATPETVQPVIDKLRGLSDDDVRGMVEREGHKWIHDWTPAESEKLSKAIVHNLHEIKESNPWARYYEGFHPAEHGELNRWLTPVGEAAGGVAWAAHTVMDAAEARLRSSPQP
jgi:hypothetical protein